MLTQIINDFKDILNFMPNPLERPRLIIAETENDFSLLRETIEDAGLTSIKMEPLTHS